MIDGTPIAVGTPKQPESHGPKNTELVDNFSAFAEEFKNETDRAAVVLGAAKLDFLLYQILNKYLIPNTGSRDELLEGDSPLSTFSAKIHLVYRLGFIDAAFARALHLVRKIRNSFAHEVSGCSLLLGGHHDRIKELARPFEGNEVYNGFKRVFFGDKDGTRSDFYTTLGAMVVRLERVLENTTQIESTPLSLVPPGKDT